MKIPMKRRRKTIGALAVTSVALMTSLELMGSGYAQDNQRQPMPVPHADPKQVPEPGAVLLRLSVAPGAPTPDELRFWIYDDSGALWDGVRVPEAGALAPESAERLGTVLIQPGASVGALRLHVRGLAAGARVLDGVVTITIGVACSMGRNRPPAQDLVHAADAALYVGKQEGRNCVSPAQSELALAS